MPDDTHILPFEIPRTRFPDAKGLFGIGLTSLVDFKEAAVVALDTNVLLVPFGTGPGTLAELRRTYSALVSANRLVIPAQVAREFAKWRPIKLAEIMDMIEKRRSHEPLMLADYPLLRDMPEAAAVRSLQTEYRTFVKKYQAAVGKLATRVRDWQFKDPVSQMYGELFKGENVIDIDEDPGALAEEMEIRYSRGLPPGYKDSTKEDGGPGDFVIWKTLLAVGRERKCDLLFVTGEEKADWWQRASGRPFLPRLELVDEYRRASDGHSLLLTSLADLLRLFGAERNTILEVQAEENTVLERMSLSEVSAERAFSSRSVDMAIGSWLRERFGSERVRVGDGFPDFLCRSADDRTLGVEWMVADRQHHVGLRIKRVLNEVQVALAAEVIDDCLLIIAIPPRTDAAVIQRIASQVPLLPANVSCVFMHFDPAGNMRTEAPVP